MIPVLFMVWSVLMLLLHGSIGLMFTFCFFLFLFFYRSVYLSDLDVLYDKAFTFFHIYVVVVFKLWPCFGWSCVCARVRLFCLFFTTMYTIHVCICKRVNILKWYVYIVLCGFVMYARCGVARGAQWYSLGHYSSICLLLAFSFILTIDMVRCIDYQVQTEKHPIQMKIHHLRAVQKPTTTTSFIHSILIVSEINCKNL